MPAQIIHCSIIDPLQKSPLAGSPLLPVPPSISATLISQSVLLLPEKSQTHLQFAAEKLQTALRHTSSYLPYPTRFPLLSK